MWSIPKERPGNRLIYAYINVAAQNLSRDKLCLKTNGAHASNRYCSTDIKPLFGLFASFVWLQVITTDGATRL
jgi:hypothetical protein